MRLFCSIASIASYVGSFYCSFAFAYSVIGCIDPSRPTIIPYNKYTNSLLICAPNHSSSHLIFALLLLSQIYSLTFTESITKFPPPHQTDPFYVGGINRISGWDDSWFWLLVITPKAMGEGRSEKFLSSLGLSCSNFFPTALACFNEESSPGTGEL